MGDMSHKGIQAAFRQTVATHVSDYGEFLAEEDGKWVRDERYVDRSVAPTDDD